MALRYRRDLSPRRVGTNGDLGPRIPSGICEKPVRDLSVSAPVRAKSRVVGTDASEPGTRRTSGEASQSLRTKRPSDLASRSTLSVSNNCTPLICAFVRKNRSPFEWCDGNVWSVGIPRARWAQTVSNRRPLLCKSSALPLSYVPVERELIVPVRGCPKLWVARAARGSWRSEAAVGRSGQCGADGRPGGGRAFGGLIASSCLGRGPSAGPSCRLCRSRSGSR